MSENVQRQHNGLFRTGLPCVSYTRLLCRHTAHMKDFLLLHGAHSAPFQRNHGYRRAFTSDEFYLVGVRSYLFDGSAHLTPPEPVFGKVLREGYRVQ